MPRDRHLLGTLLDITLALRSTRINNAVMIELDMEIRRFSHIVGVSDAAAVDQTDRRHQRAIDQNAVALGHIQISIRNAGRQRTASNPHRRLRYLLANNILDGPKTPIAHQHQIPGRKILNRPLAIPGDDLGALQKTIVRRTPRASIILDKGFHRFVSGLVGVTALAVVQVKAWADSLDRVSTAVTNLGSA